MAILLWKNAVTDRTQSDVERVLELLKKGWQSFTHEEKETWQNGFKGALNLSDLLRIQNNVSLLKEVLELDIEVFNLGKNLLKNTATSRTINGVTFTVNEDGSVTVNGTATSYADFYFFGSWDSSKVVIPSDEYIVTCYGNKSVDFNGVYNTSIKFCVYRSTFDKPITFSSELSAVYIHVDEGVTVSNETIYPMIRLASIADDTYEPYSGRNLYVPTQEMYSELLGNVEVIRGAYCIHADTPPTPSAPLNTFQKWNDIEKILLDVYEILMNNFSYYCGGEIYAGDTSGLLL